jgi:hypothetical protein
MSTVWGLVATFALPTPLALLMLLNLPVPKSVHVLFLQFNKSRTNLILTPSSHHASLSLLPCRPFKRGVYIFVSRVLDLPIVGIFRALHVMLFLLGLCFLSAVRTLATLQESHLNNSAFATPKYEIMYLSKRWRSERNMWLAGFAFSMWAVLAAFYRELGRRLQLEDRLVDFEMSGYTMTADETTREPSVSREVTSRTELLSPRSISGSPVKPRRSAPPSSGGAAAAAAGNEGRPPRPPASTPSPVAPVPEEIELVAPTAAGNKMDKKDN